MLYNKHLAVSKSLRRKPFKLKKDFSDIVDTEKHKHLKRISTLFKKHPELDPDLFFKAPYMLYPDVQYFSLEYYSSLRAIKSYTTYKKTIMLQDPDQQIESVKNSFKFIANFCVQNKIHLHNYARFQLADNYAWMTHYKQNKINLYCLFEFSDVFTSLKNLAEDVQRFFVGELLDQFQTLYINYNKSQHLKPYVKKAFPVLSDFVHKQIS